MSKDKIKGGLADKKSKKDIANKFKVSIQKIEKELGMGTKIEMEHVNSKSMAKEIAMDHLVEIPDYYTRLKKMEKEAKKKWNIKESNKSNIKKLLREEVELQITDETPDVETYAIIYNGREVGMLGVTNETEMYKAMELVFVELHPDYKDRSMKIISEVVVELWERFTDIQTILLSPLPESKNFWHKMGVIRLNDDYLMFQRGH